MACTIDFRRLDEGLSGQKNKRKRKRPESEPQPESANQSMDLDDAIPSSKRQALPSATDASKPSYSRPNYDGTIAGKVSGRTWKHVRNQRASAARVSRRCPSLELRTKENELKRAFKERVNELKEEIRLSKVEKRRKREEREKKKKENILTSGTKLQVITNPKTLQKIAKSKERKLLHVVPDEVVSGGKKGKKKKNKWLIRILQRLFQLLTVLPQLQLPRQQAKTQSLTHPKQVFLKMHVPDKEGVIDFGDSDTEKTEFDLGWSDVEIEKEDAEHKSSPSKASSPDPKVLAAIAEASNEPFVHTDEVLPDPPTKAQATDIPIEQEAVGEDPANVQPPNPPAVPAANSILHRSHHRYLWWRTEDTPLYEPNQELIKKDCHAAYPHNREERAGLHNYFLEGRDL